MNYIGSKYKLSDFISSSVKSIVGDDLSDKIFCDLFAGTGVVGRNFKKEVKKVIFLKAGTAENCQPARTEKTDSRLISREAVVGFNPFCPMICRV